MIRLILMAICAIIFLSACDPDENSVNPQHAIPDSRVDSVQLILTETSESDLPNAFFIHSMAFDSRDRLWIGTRHAPQLQGGGLHCYDTRTGEWKRYPLPGTLDGVQAQEVVVGKNDVVYVHPWPRTGWPYLFAWDGEAWAVDTFPHDIRYFDADPLTGDLWVSTGTGLYQVHDAQRVFYDSSNSPVDDVRGIAVMPGGGLWVVSGSRLIYYDNTDWKIVDTIVTAGSTNLLTLAAFQDTTVWLGLSAQLYRYSTEGMKNDLSNRLSSAGLEALALKTGTDPDKLFMSDFSRISVYHMAHDTLTIVDQNNSILKPGGGIWTAAFDNLGRIWAGGDRMLFRLPD